MWQLFTPRVQITAPELEDLACQAVGDALLAITEKVMQFRGESRFTTWAYKSEARSVIAAAISSGEAAAQLGPAPSWAMDAAGPIGKSRIAHQGVDVPVA